MQQRNLFAIKGVLIGIILIAPSLAFAQRCDQKTLIRVRFGQQSAAVKNFQECLIKLGFQIPAGSTGYYGSQTRSALKGFYRSVMNVELDGGALGPLGLQTIKKFAEGDSFVGDAIRKVASKDELRYYLTKSSELQKNSLGVGASTNLRLDFTVPTNAAPAVTESVAPSRVSETTVQVKGIDEPDIVKTDGVNIYFARQSALFSIPESPNRGIAIEELCGTVGPGAPEGVEYRACPKSSSQTSIIKAFPPTEMASLSTIDMSGDLLLLKESNILTVLGNQKITGYDVSDKKNPKEKWSIKLEENNGIVSSRLYNNKIYIVTRQYLNYNDPCPIRPLLRGTFPIIIDCLDIYRPSRIIPVDVSYTASVINPLDGTVIKNVSFLGSAQDSVIYMSPNALYVTYYYPESQQKIVAGALVEEGADLFPSSLVQRAKQLSSYDISDEAKLVELQGLISKHLNALDNDQQLRIQTEWSNRLSRYIKKHKRDLEKTTIVKISLSDFSISKNGVVPGYPLNQFAIDEYNGFLRIAVTVGERLPFGWWWGGQRDSTNDVYVLNHDFTIAGKIQDLGVTERIYAARFIEDRGYLVTFRQTDPFYVLDLADPFYPTLNGELKIPGYSSFLQPIGPHKILGIGQENWQVKAAIFDVANPSQPVEKNRYLFQDSWSEVLSNHRAFLLDEKHKIFFLPGGNGGYVMSYDTDKLSLVATSAGYAVKRAIYIDDYLYIIGENQIGVFNETNWNKIKEFGL